MKAKNREINIFNMSLLDILTGALGAFLFLMLGMLPAYIQQHGGGGAGQGSGAVEEKIEKLERRNAQLSELLQKGTTGEAKDMNSVLQAKVEELTTEVEDFKKYRPDIYLLDENKGIIILSANKPVGLELWQQDEDGSWRGPKDQTPWGEKARHVVPPMNFWDKSEGRADNHPNVMPFLYKYIGFNSFYYWLPPAADTEGLVITGYFLYGNLPLAYNTYQLPAYRVHEAGKMNLLGAIEVRWAGTKQYFPGSSFPRVQELLQYMEDYVKASPEKRVEMHVDYVAKFRPLSEDKPKEDK